MRRASTFQNTSMAALGRQQGASARLRPDHVPPHPCHPGVCGQVPWPADLGVGPEGTVTVELRNGQGCSETPQCGEQAQKGGRQRAVPFTPCCLFSLVLFTLLCNAR